MKTEYDWWYKKVKSFKPEMRRLAEKCCGKKVVIYCNGIYFDALNDVYDLKNLFDIRAVSDLRYENNEQEEYRGFRCVKPSKLSETDFDYLLVASGNFKNINDYLSQYGLTQKILPLFFEKDSFFEKLRLVLKVRNPIKAVKYLICCSQEEIQTKLNYERVLKRIRKQEKVRALFICEENSKWSLQELYNSLRENEKFEVLPVVLFPIVTMNRIEYTQKENTEFFKCRNVETIDGYDYERNTNRDIKEFEPDIVFYQQPWYLNNSNHPVEVSNYALTVMFPYGYTTLNPESWGSNAVKEVYSNLWTFFSESPYHNKFYKKAAGMVDNLYASGSLKLDEYRKKSAGRVDDRKTIIWAPHHSITNEGLRMGTFLQNNEFFINFAKNHPEYKFVLKPHPALRNTCITQGFDYDNFLQKWCELDNTEFYNKGDYFGIFKDSDLLITDCSSFLAEYFPSGNPIILLDRNDRAPFDEFGEKIAKGFYKVETADEIESLAAEIFNNDRLKNTRNQIIKRNFFIPKTGAKERVVGYLEKALYF